MVKAVVRAGVVALGLAWGAIAPQAALDGEIERYVVDGSPAAERESCVEPTETMRRMHMEFIKHQRISTVHEGIRGTKYSLSGCVDCHISYDENRNPRPIDQPDQFCGACHNYAAVDLNCFDCHASVPNRPGADAEAAHRAAGVMGRVASTPPQGGR